MDAVQLCEIGMLVAFGISWPFNILKSWRSRTAKGKSVIFEYLVVFGYLIGLLGKYISWRRTGVLAWSVWFYIFCSITATPPWTAGPRSWPKTKNRR